jgi:outer membrane protein OmpA-like peptidoglycan-associated protein
VQNQNAEQTMKRQTFYPAVLTLSLCTTSALANTVGTGSQLFNPATSSSEFVTVQSSRVMNQGWYSFGLFFNHATNPLPYQDTEAQSRSRTNDSLTGMDAFVGYGLLPKTEIGIVFPFIVDQDVKEDETRGEFAQRGNTEVRALVKQNFLQRSAWGLSGIFSGNLNRTAEDPHSGAQTSPAYNFEMIGDITVGKIMFAGNLGYRYRKKGEKIEGALTDAIGSQYMASLAARYQVHTRLSLLAEAFGGQPADKIDQETDRSTDSAEMLAGARYKLAKTTYAHGGIGSELLHGYATADWRAYLGIVTEFGPGKSGRTVVKKKKQKAPKASKAQEESYPTEIPTRAPDEVFVLHHINFEFDSDFRVLPGAINELQKLTDHLAGRPYEKIVVEGHTDYYGTDEYNDDLSQRRARAVRRQMIRHYGFEAGRLVPVGYGERVPFTEDMSDAGRQLNRRVEIKIYYPTEAGDFGADEAVTH